MRKVAVVLFLLVVLFTNAQTTTYIPRYKSFVQIACKGDTMTSLWCEARNIICPECGSEKLKKWNPKTGKCPKCGGVMEKTDMVLMVD